MCFDIPLRSSQFTLTGTLGYSVAFWKDNVLSAGSQTQKKGFVTTGVSVGLRKFRFLSLTAGCAWSQYNQLSGYRADKYYFNDFTDAEINNAVRRVISPAFYLGLSVNL